MSSGRLNLRKLLMYYRTEWRDKAGDRIKHVRDWRWLNSRGLYSPECTPSHKGQRRVIELYMEIQRRKEDKS